MLSAKNIFNLHSLSYLIILLCSTITFTFAQSVSFDYTYGYADYSYGKSIVQLPDSSYVLLANTGATHGNARLLLIRIDSKGFPIYHKEFSDYYLYNGNHLIQAKNGDLLITGEIKNNGEPYQPFIMRVDTLFQFQWCLLIPTQDWAFGKQIVELPNDDIVMVGKTYDTDSTNVDGLWVKVSNNGTLKNKQFSNLMGNDDYTSISLWNDSLILVSGYQKDILTSDTVSFYAFFNFNGEVIDKNVYNNKRTKAVANQAIKDSNHNIVNVGYTRMKDSTGHKDFFMLVYDTVGSNIFDSYINYEIWANKDNEYSSATVGINGDIVLGANTDGNNYHKPTILLHCYHQNNYDYNTSTARGGNIFTKADYLSEIIATSDGGYILIGSTTCLGTHLSDILVCKIDSNLSPMTEISHHLSIKNDNFALLSSVFPNPTQDRITLIFNSIENENIQVTLFNLHAKIVWKTTHNFYLNPSLDIDLSNFSAGIYLLQIKGNNFQETVKISKI